MTAAPDRSRGPDAVVEALRAVPQVRLHEGSVIGTHLPGRRVTGVRVGPDGVEVHLAVVHPTTVAAAAQAVRDALAPLALGRVDVHIDDVVLPDDDPVSGQPPEVEHA